MKKIKFFVRQRATVVNEFAFMECSGYLDTIINPKDIFDKINIVYAKDENGFWYSTHYESGLRITNSDTKKDCIEKTKELTEALFIRVNQPDVKKMVEELNYYRNKLVEKELK